MQFSDLIARGQTMPNGAVSFHIPEDWMQGRTTYGGLTSALCLAAALPLAGERPIRAAQIAFVGPVSGDVTCHATLLREGKNTVFASVRMIGADGIAAEAIFTFGTRRQSSLRFANLVAPSVCAPEEAEDYFSPEGRRPAFTNHFDMRLAKGTRPMSGSDKADLAIWMRHDEEDLATDSFSLIALADAPPPAAMSLLSGPARVSSMTWMTEFLTDDIQTQAGWFLARHVADTSSDGYSSQSMTMWNTKMEPVMIGRQTIAVFT